MSQRDEKTRELWASAGRAAMAGVVLAGMALALLSATGCEDPNAAPGDTSTGDTPPANAPAGDDDASDGGAAPDGGSPAGEPERPLETELAAFSAGLAGRIPADAIEAHAQGRRDVAEMGLIATATNEGDRAPGFELPRASDGAMVSLEDALANGPVIVTWYRGKWCPYCQIALGSYKKSHAEFAARNATLFALTPERPDVAKELVDAADYPFEVLSDVGLEVAQRYGIAYRTPEVAQPHLEQAGVVLPQVNSGGDWQLPLAVTYIIGQDGVIKWAFLSSDYTLRAEPADIIAALDEL